MTNYTYISTVLMVVIKQYRKKLGMTQAEMALLSGTSRAKMSKLEKGQLSSLDADTLFGICRGLEISVTDLVNSAEIASAKLGLKGWTILTAGNKQDSLLPTIELQTPKKEKAAVESRSECYVHGVLSRKPVLEETISCDGVEFDLYQNTSVRDYLSTEIFVNGNEAAKIEYLKWFKEQPINPIMPK